MYYRSKPWFYINVGLTHGLSSILLCQNYVLIKLPEDFVSKKDAMLFFIMENVCNALCCSPLLLLHNLYRSVYTRYHGNV